MMRFSAPIEFVNSRSLQGRSLRNYEILGEIPGDGYRCFTAKLLLDGPVQEVKVRYYVLGARPLLVLSDEEYARLNHWDFVDGDVPMPHQPAMH